MCSMVETEGPIEVASQSAERGEDRKVDQVVCELAKYGVVVEELQETKWFGSEIYEVNDSVILPSGRSTPAQGETVQRGEGVAQVLRSLALVALEAWWETVEGLELKMCVNMLAGDWECWEQDAHGVLLCTYKSSE